MIARGVFVLGLALTVAPSVLAQEPSLDTVLARAATYVADFQKQLAGIVAEESYVQEVTALTGRSTRNSVLPRRTLKSDLLLVKPDGSDRYIEFRDVFEVDGRPVRDREDRLTKLFLDPAAASTNQAHSIITESARYNIGNIPRTMNTPMLPMMFLQSSYQSRFRFKRTAVRKPDVSTHFGAARDDTPTFSVTTEMWVIEFRETERRTIIRTPAGSAFPATGRFWIDPATGVVLMTELVMSSADVLAVVDVSYQSEPLLGFRVPVEMRERYQARADRLEGAATYSRFRKFQVRTGEEIATPDKPPAKPPQ